MSKYTTGEMAKLCNVSVRTVQYYDSRNILVPSELTEGGRRLYSEEDLKKMQVICFLREIDLPLDSIAKIFEESNSNKIIALLLEQQELVLREEVDERQKKLNTLEQIKRELKTIENFSVQSLGDIAQIMKNKEKRNQMLRRMILMGIVMEILEVAVIAYGIQTGIWWPTIPGICVIIALGIYASIYYYNHTKFICPECHEIFRPAFKETFFAAHTPKTRRLTCPRCNHKGFCVELYAEEEKNENV